MKNDDLDNLKSTWNAAANEQKVLGQEDLLPLIQRQTQTVFSKMRRNLLLEVAIGALAMIAWVYFVGRIVPGNGEAYLAALQMTLMTVLPLSFFYYEGFRNLNLGMASDSRLVPALQRTIAHWEQVLRLYFWGGAALIPTFLLSAVWFTNCLGGQYLLKITDAMPWLHIVVWVAGLSGITILFVWISIRISYGKHLSELKACLRELEEAV
ncbi:MAG: hypothetical protein ACKVU2_09945 [Saprospiraceae bacterium]